MEEGPRGDAIKFSREYLNKDPEATQNVISKIGLKGDYLMRDVYTQFKVFIPCALYTRHQIDSAKLQ